MSELKKALEVTSIKIKKFDTGKVRPVYTEKGSYSIKRFTEELREALGDELVKHPSVVMALNSPAKMEKLLDEYAQAEGLLPDDSSEILVPEEVSHLTLNIDRSCRETGGKRFFCTTSDEYVDKNTSGQYYLDACSLTSVEGVKIARPVVPRYMPRDRPGIKQEADWMTGLTVDYFNTFVPSEWAKWKKDNPKLWAKLPDRAPKEVLTLIKHIIPLREEREYFYAWLYASITSRAYVFLVLCGNPGVGKNRLKLLIRALHGAHNSADGKKETFGHNENKFNSQMEENTLIWFDELKYGPDMEARMKEYQNDYISIERKGVDATKSTEIFSSMVISNNYLRDNYLPFNSRKFAPLVLAKKDLRYSMDPDEIDYLSNVLDSNKPEFNVKYVAQCAKWILKWGGKYLKKWPNLEYRGPKFWELAHASMSRWQKIAVLATTVKNSRGPTPGWDSEKNAFLWSKTEEALRRKKEYESREYRDATTVRAFFDNFCDQKGNKVFETESAGTTDNSFHDFWIRPIEGLQDVKGTVSLTTAIVEKGDQPKLIRPIGMSDFKWRRMKEEFERRGKANGKETKEKN